MKDPSFISRRRKPKVKLICSFNGAFQRRPPTGKLRYVGGETRIISVDRNIGFSKLKSKILDLYPLPRSFSLIYHLPVEEQDTPLVVITCDDDVLCMIEEYEKFETLGKHPRLWIFVCNDNDNASSVDLRFNFDELSRITMLNANRKSTIVKKQAISGSDDSLRKIVLKQQLLAKQIAKIRNNHSDSRITLEETGVEYANGNDKCDDSFISLSSKPETLLYHDNSFPVSHSHPFNTTDGNVRVKLNGSLHSHISLGDGDRPKSGSSGHFGESVQFLKLSFEHSMNTLSNKNRENIIPGGLGSNTVQTDFVAPVYCGNQLVGSGYPSKSAHPSFHNGIRSHRLGLSDLRNLRACPYHFRGHKSTLNEMGNHKIVRLDGGPSAGHLGLRAASNVSKDGQAMRSYHLALWKPFSYSHIEKVEQAARTTDCGLNRQTELFNVPYGPRGDQHEAPRQTLCKTLLKVPTNDEPYCDTNTETSLMDQQDVLSISTFSNNTGYSNETGIGSNGKLLDREAGCKSFINHQNSDNSLQGGIACSVDISLHNLSLTSIKKETPPATPLAAGIDVSEALLKPNSKVFDTMDEEQFTSGPQVEKSSKTTSTSFYKMDQDDDEKADIQQKPQSNLSIDDKEKIRVTQHKCLKINGGVRADLATFYTHLATRELQTISNSDLEYIKELGSGSYGSVFYGKWKGSDVAIKKIKPSCFTEGAVEEERLVADFWKEAHILGQLHHPNIVALYGVVTDGPVMNLAAVTEYMVNGSLKQVLRRNDRTIDRRKRLILAMDAAFGMEYLHGKNIVHFDLKSHNFLVNMRDPQRPVCKIGDLGLSKIKQKTLVSGGIRGTIPWMAPELLNTENMVTEKVDVYSFGIVMWELLTGEEPYANMRLEEIIAGIIRGNLRPEIPSWCDPVWRSLMERCWSPDPDARPPFSEIAKELRAMAAAMNIK